MESQDADVIIAGFSSKPQPLTPAAAEPAPEPEPEPEPDSPTGSDDAIKILHHEIQSLRRDRADLQLRMEHVLSDMDKSDAATKSLSARASSLESHLLQTQQELDSAAKEASQLKSEKESIKKELQDKIADLELERGRKDGEIRVLKQRIKEIEVQSKDKLDEKEDEIRRLIQEAANEKVVWETAKVKELEDKAMENGLSGRPERTREVEVAVAGMATWEVAVAAAVVSGAVAVAVTALCLRRR